MSSDGHEDLVARLEHLAANYEANHLTGHARGVHHAIREVQAFFAATCNCNLPAGVHEDFHISTCPAKAGGNQP